METMLVVVEVKDDEGEGEDDKSPIGEMILVESMTNFEPLGISEQARTSGLKTFGGLSSEILVDSMTNFEPLGISEKAPTSGLKTFGGLSSDQEMMELASMTVIGSCVPNLEVDLSDPTPRRVVI
ncbi:hypothetical protein HAX54_028560 [Datura stramonium]|uniref:Uncharacterized protein n=1 Tax=Datura stramonium TaxID=4076 RepID=A0ABS8S9L8_DATST|nr:hypothetical protein [Datura stramonium]